ncbi:hypothetical protein Dimus_021464 [Dionaea muscipula]
MRGYDRTEEDLDEYEEEGSDQFEDVEGDEYEEAEEEEIEDPARQREISEYLVLRQKLKEQARKKLEKECGASQKNSLETKKSLPLRNFGSFFGPSQPVIADRVIQESKSFLETRHLASQVSTTQHDRKKGVTPVSSGPKNVGSSHVQSNHVRNPVISKVQKLKDTRDYSFLISDNAEGPGPPKNPMQQSHSDARSAQAPAKSKVTSSHSGRPAFNGHAEKRSVTSNHHMHGVPGHSVQRLSSGSKPISATLSSNRDLGCQRQLEPKKQFPSSNGSGPGRPAMSKDAPSQKRLPSMEKGAPVTMEKRSVASSAKKTPVPSVDKKASAVGMKHTVNNGQRPALLKPQPSGARQHIEQKEYSHGSSKQKILPQKSVSSSKPQMANPPKQVPPRNNLAEVRHKKRPKPSRRFSDDEDDGQEAFSIIRKMFGYNPRKYVDDDDISDMEADYSTILQEEKKSARIAKEEDERELRLLEEEERREKMRKDAKRRKLSQR